MLIIVLGFEVAIGVSVRSIELLVKPSMLKPIQALFVSVIMDCIDLIMHIAVLLIYLIVLFVVFVTVAGICLSRRWASQAK